MRTIDKVIPLEQIISEAVNGNESSLDVLMTSPWMIGLVSKVSASACRTFKVDADEVRDAIYDKVRYRIHTVKKPNRVSWTNCITAWCYATARNHCRNVGRHSQLVKKYSEQVIAQYDNRGVQISATGHVIPLRPLTMNSPEEILLEKEEATLWNSRKAALCEKVQRIAVTLPPGDLKIATLWSQGMTPKEISAATDRPLPTVYSRLHRVSKVISTQLKLSLPTSMVVTFLRSCLAEDNMRSTLREWSPPKMKASEAVALLQSWYSEDADEQKESWERLRVALDEDRLSDRKLFS